MGPLGELSVLVLAGWTSGISVYLTAAILGIGSRAGWIELPGALSVLEHPLLIGLAVLIYVVEFVADKVPFVDSAWDSVHTFIRPAAAGAAGYLAGTEYGSLAQTGLAMMTGTLALDAHAVKASTRLAINTSPEPFSNIAASLAEDSFVVFLFWFFVKHPVLACLTIVALLVLSYFILRLLWKFVAGVFRLLTGRGRPKPAPEASPPSR
ncbi:MAG: hypothetical protein MOGMAGMI_01592 [Candidatus Omnitrophica bacterium]|nr:hypothetical protein [Candidatus Omnitrophota bacterium]